MHQVVLPIIPRVVAEDIHLFTMDDYSPHALLGGEIMGTQVVQWQYAVELTYRCLTSGLCELMYEPSPRDGGSHDFTELCSALSRLDPFDLSEEGESYWLNKFMCGTQALLDIVSDVHVGAGAGAGAGTFEDRLFEAVDSHFAASGVPWSDGCLFPVGAK